RLFTRPSLAAAPDGTRGTLMVPQFNGGANWEGGAADPETGFVYVGTARNFSTIALAPANGQVTADYFSSGAGPRGPGGLAASQAAVRADCRIRHEQGRDCLGNCEWRYASEHQRQRSPEGTQYS